MEMLGEQFEAMLREAEQRAGQIEVRRSATKTESMDLENDNEA